MMEQVLGRRYIVHPGWITSRADGDRHFIRAGQLIRLYGISINECLVCAHCQGRKMLPCMASTPGYVDLWPRYSGDYTRPNQSPDAGKMEEL